MQRVKNIAQHVTGSGDVRSASFVDELATLAALFREGLLSESEYAAGKQKLLAPAAPAAEGNALVSQEAAAAGTAQPVEMTDQEKFLYDLYSPPTPAHQPTPPHLLLTDGAGKASCKFQGISPPRRSTG